MNTEHQALDQIKILFVDDAENMLRFYKRTLDSQYLVHTTISTIDALQILKKQGPFAALISDYQMPGMNGLAFLKIARKISPDTIQILITGTPDLEIAVQAVNEVNIFRYLPKPCPVDALQQVIKDAVEHYHLLLSKRRLTEALEAKNQQLEHELEMAKTVFNKVLSYGRSDFSGLDFHLASMESVGGDFLLTHFANENNTLYILLGDLTGHGLPAALAALLVSEVFAEKSVQNCSLIELVQHINDKMCRTLPTGLFCAALVVRLDFIEQCIDFWQGGLPDAYLLDEDGKVIFTIPSENLALGVIADPSIKPKVVSLALNKFNSLFACSDGVTEQQNENMEMFGAERLISVLKDVPENRKRVDFLAEQLEEYRQSKPQSDDLSLFELNIGVCVKGHTKKSISSWII